MLPHVSICIPAYEEASLLARALGSVFEQSFADFEVIVTDDSASSAVEAAIAPWRSDPRMKYVRNDRRLGSPENWNRAIELAQARLIKVLHHDDWFSGKDSLRQYVSLIEDQPRAIFAFSASLGCDAGGRPLSRHTPSAQQIEALREDSRCLFTANFIGAPSATIFRRKEGFRFDPALKWLVDVDAYVRILRGGQTIGYSPEPLINVTELAPHQITRAVEADSTLQFIENVYVYKSLGLTGIQRLRFAWFFANLGRGLDACGVDTVFADPRAQDLPLEARMPLFLHKLRLAVRQCFRRVPHS